jgi:hypothetical protein
MNMTELLERSRPAQTAEQVAPTARPSQPPPTGTSATRRAGPGRWPTGAKVLVALLAFAALLGAAGTIVGFSSDDIDTDQLDRLESELDRLESDLGQARTDVDSLTAERNAALTSVADADEQLAEVRAQLLATEAARDDLGADAAELEQEVASLLDEAAALENARGEALASAVALEADLATANARATAAIAERDALVASFPIEFDGSLAVADVSGKYDVDLSEVYCSGSTSCGKLPTIASAMISATSQSYLRLTMAPLPEMGLFRIDGGLHAVAESTAVLPACDGVARRVHVAMTIYPHGFEVADDGAVEVTSLAASITVEAPATGTCPAALVAYGAELATAA